MLVPVRFNVQFLLKIHWIIYVYCLCHSTYDSIIKVTIWDKEVIYLILKAYWGDGGRARWLIPETPSIEKLGQMMASLVFTVSTRSPSPCLQKYPSFYPLFLFLREYFINFCLQTYLDKTFNVLCLHKWKRISSTFVGQYGCWFLYNRVS